MKPAELVQELRGRGYELFARGDKLVCRGPLAELADSVVAAMKANKPTILRILADEQEAEELRAYALARCAECRRIMAAYWMEADSGVCNECRALPRPGVLFEEGD